MMDHADEFRRHGGGSCIRRRARRQLCTSRQLTATGAQSCNKVGGTMRFAWIVALLLLPLLANASGVDPTLLEAARKEGEVVWYTGLIVNQITRPMAAAFEARFPGITVQYSRASNTETTLKMLNEARAHRVQADVFDVTSGIYSAAGGACGRGVSAGGGGSIIRRC